MATLLPCCPLCDNPIGVYEAHVLYVEGEYKALAHEDCIVDIGDDDEDDGYPDDKDDDDDDDDGGYLSFGELEDEEDREDEW